MSKYSAQVNCRFFALRLCMVSECLHLCDYFSSVYCNSYSLISAAWLLKKSILVYGINILSFFYYEFLDVEIETNCLLLFPSKPEAYSLGIKPHLSFSSCV